MSTRLAKRSVSMFLAATLDVGYSTFDLGRYLQFNPKKVPPPTPDGREGRLFPPEQSSKTPLLVIELTGRRNKILCELMQRTTRFVKNLSPNLAAPDSSFNRRHWRSALEDKEQKRGDPAD